MAGRLDGKVALITGAGSGMGRATAELFAREGARVAVTDVDGQSAHGVAEAIGEAATDWHLDVSSEPEVASVTSDVISQWGRLDVLVNAAGVIGVDKPTHEVTEKEWDDLFAVDVKGVFFTTKHAVPQMMTQGAGSIVNFSSIYGLVGNDEFTPYHVAKGAVTMQTKQDAATYGRYGIRVNSVHPSTVLTPLVQGIADAYDGGLEAYETMMTAQQSIRRLGRPDEVAYAVVWLASDESPWVTGVNLPIDGGYTAR
ncbi:SDR family oxidoreductase [soil metagenome]